MKASDFVEFPSSLGRFAEFFSGSAAPWEWVPMIGRALESIAWENVERSVPSGVHIEGRVYLDPSVELPHVATLIGPLWLAAGCVVRPGALLRGNVIAGEGCVFGHACEFKNCLLLDRAQAPHFNYVGDSVLGNRSHIGAGVILSNLRLDQREVAVADGHRRHPTGLRKLGAFLGDGAEVGCNSVLQPGTVLGRGSIVYPCLPFGGHLPAGHVARHSAAPATIIHRPEGGRRDPKSE